MATPPPQLASRDHALLIPERPQCGRAPGRAGRMRPTGSRTRSWQVRPFITLVTPWHHPAADCGHRIQARAPFGPGRCWPTRQCPGGRVATSRRHMGSIRSRAVSGRSPARGRGPRFRAGDPGGEPIASCVSPAARSAARLRCGLAPSAIRSPISGVAWLAMGRDGVQADRDTPRRWPWAGGTTTGPPRPFHGAHAARRPSCARGRAAARAIRVSAQLG